MDNYQSGGGQTPSGMNAQGSQYGNSAYGGDPYYGGNPYNQVSYSAGSGNGSGPEKKKKRLVAKLLLVLGVLGILGGAGAMFFAVGSDRVETGEAVDVYDAEKPDQYVFTPVQYMTDAVAYYEAMDKVEFYITFDADWNPAVVCIHDDKLAEFQPYIDWLYSDSYENEPEIMNAIGYAEPYDEELKQLVIEGFEENIGAGYVDMSNFEEWFGEYYVQIGQKSSAYGISNMGIYVMLAGIALVVIGGALAYDKRELAANQSASMSGPVIEESHAGLGFLGALLGVLLGGVLWAVVGVMGYVSGWIGLLILFFGYTGYKLLAKKEGIRGKLISLALGVLVIIPASYLSYVWVYYQSINESVAGYTSLMQAFSEFPGYMTKFDGWKDFITDILTGYVFFGVAGVYWLIGSLSGRSREKKQDQKLKDSIKASQAAVNADPNATSYTGNPYDTAAYTGNPYEMNGQGTGNQDKN